MSAETAAVLREARALIENPEDWTKGAYHANGCWCAVGAVMEVTNEWELHRAATEALDNARRVQKSKYNAPRERVIAYNDNSKTKHHNVLALFDRAIAAEEASA